MIKIGKHMTLVLGNPSAESKLRVDVTEPFLKQHSV